MNRNHEHVGLNNTKRQVIAPVNKHTTMNYTSLGRLLAVLYDMYINVCPETVQITAAIA